MKSYIDGEIIFREGEAGQDTYAINKGLVALSKETSHGPVEIEVLSAGANFGEIGVMNGGKRTLTAKAVGEVRVNIVSSDNNGAEVQEKPRSGNSEKSKKPRAELLKHSPEEQPTKRAVKKDEQSWWSRLLHRDGRTSSKIEIRIVPFAGDEGMACTKKVQEALQHCADVKVRVVNREGPFAQKNGISKNNVGVCIGAARKILKSSTGDILIWGEVPPQGKSMHLHFVSALANDEDAAGSFNGYDLLPLPLELDEAWTALLHGVILASTVPCSVAKAKNINTHIEPAMELGATAAQQPPREFHAVERACLQICLAHSVSVVARRLEEYDLLGFAAETYGRAIELITAEDSPIIWGMAHKHLGNIHVLIAERMGDPSALNDAQSALQIAVDTLPRRRLPREWAAAQNKLGQVIYKLDYADPSLDIARLSKAIEAFQSAIQVYTRVDAPERWAEVMNNYAQAAQVIGQQFHEPDMLQKAVSACRSALEVRRRNRTPLLWAATQNTLGSALFLLGKQVGRIDHLESAIDAFRAAHAVYSGKGARKMSRVIARNLEHVQSLLEDYRSEQEREQQWFEDSDNSILAESVAAELPDDKDQWWKDNVVDKSYDPFQDDYQHPSSQINSPLNQKLSHSSRH
ncbi:MAG: cyclic nucleotide-binding domain-containing protein [Rhodospirillales bacterium]|nr:cyclic nucleotide-binding domain-containing protein [Rhodospirillales bacterium]